MYLYMILGRDLKGWALHFDVPTVKSLYLRADAYGTTTFNGNQSYLLPGTEHSDHEQDCQNKEPKPFTTSHFRLCYCTRLK